MTASETRDQSIALFRHNLKRLRREHFLSQRDLAKLLGMHQAGIARIECGWHLPSFDLACRIADALYVDLSEFREKT